MYIRSKFESRLNVLFSVISDTYEYPLPATYDYQLLVTYDYQLPVTYDYQLPDRKTDSRRVRVLYQLPESIISAPSSEGISSPLTRSPHLPSLHSSSQLCQSRFSPCSVCTLKVPPISSRPVLFSPHIICLCRFWSRVSCL